MNKNCSLCDSAMIRASLYDPDGEVALTGGVRVYQDKRLVDWWICINPKCEDGKRNTALAKEKDGTIKI